eukprot:maker-scaffold_5-snap-gene-3.41-mRNA-1 protein AED:0.29 eAED:0.30 QI:122/0.33/0.25/1/0/0/4/0/146
MPFYASQAWDPKFICAQICAVQCLAYISLGILLILLNAIFNIQMSLSFLFDARKYGRRSRCYNDNSPELAYLKCLDFAFTTHLIHLIFCTLYAGFPDTLDWWILNIVAMIIMASLGEHLCSRLELSEINVSDFLNFRPDKSSSSIV